MILEICEYADFGLVCILTIFCRITVLGLAQDAAHDASTRVPKSLVLRAETRKTYRAVLSEPTLVVPLAVAEGLMDVDQPPLKRSHETTEPTTTVSTNTERSKKKKKKADKD